MKKNDVLIITNMRKNSRENLTTMSKNTGVPVSTIFDKIRQHKGKLIKKFTVILNFAEIGYPIKTKIFLKVEPLKKRKVKEYLTAHPQVNSLWQTNNGYDYVAECIFKSLKEVEDFTEHIELEYNVIDNKVYHLIDDIAIEKAYSAESPIIANPP